MTIARARRDDVEIAYESFGGPPGDPLLLVMGVGAQMLYWHDEFCAALAERRFWVARFDNRDAGLSTHLSAAGVPSQLKMLRRPAEAAVYRLEDMADDAVAVLDALGWQAAHVVGRSLGGMIAQTIAVRHPSRVLSLTSISSTPSPRIGRQTVGTTLRLLVGNPSVLRRRPASSPEEVAEQMVRGTASSARTATRWTKRGWPRLDGACSSEEASIPPVRSARTRPSSQVAIAGRRWPACVCPHSCCTVRPTR